MCRIRVILVWLILFISYFGLYAEPNDSTVSITATELKYTNFDFIKTGKYDQKLGSINKITTNQRLYQYHNLFHFCFLNILNVLYMSYH